MMGSRPESSPRSAGEHGETHGSTRAVYLVEATRSRTPRSTPASVLRVARRPHDMSSVDPELPEPLRRDAAAIVAAFQRARERHAFEGAELRTVVETFVRTAQRLAVPPERMLVLLKHVVREQALSGVNAWFRTVMTERAASWAIDAYFRISGRLGEETSPR